VINRVFTGAEFGGIVVFPFPTAALCRIVVCDKLVAFAEAVFETTDIRVYAAELWAKYSGAARCDQEHHRNYLNHTRPVPSCSDQRWRGHPMGEPLGDRDRWPVALDFATRS
jgi:hypothetical protein